MTQYLYGTEDQETLDKIKSAILTYQAQLLSGLYIPEGVSAMERYDSYCSDKYLMFLQKQLYDFYSTTIPIGIIFDPPLREIKLSPEVAKVLDDDQWELYL